MECNLEYSAISLAKKYDEVFACNQTVNNLMALKKQADINLITNIRYFCWFNSSFLPIKDNLFDVVYINNDFPKINSEFFSEVWRILKYNGTLYLSAENKFSYKKIQHFGKNFARFFLSANDRKRGEQSLSIYGYKKLLKKAGFKQTKVFSLIPNYNEIRTIEDIGRVAFFKKKKDNDSESLNLKKIIKNSNITKKYLAHNLGFLSKKTGELDSTIDLIISEITASSNSGRWEISDPAFQVTQKGTFVFNLRNVCSKQDIIVKASLNSEAKKQLDQNFQQICFLHENDYIAEDLKGIVPRPIMSSYCNKYHYYAEERKSGKTAVSFHESPEIFNKIIKNSAQKILQLHLATRFFGKPGSNKQKNLIEKKIGQIHKVLGTEHNTFIEALSCYLKKKFLTENLPFVFHKGDCSAHNILVSQNHSITAFIDWDQSLQRGFPLVDLINLIESFKRHSLKQGMGNILTNYLFPEKLSILENELFCQYCNQMDISKKMIFPLSIIYWIEHITAQDFTHDSKWMKNNIFHVMHYLQKVI